LRILFAGIIILLLLITTIITILSGARASFGFFLRCAV
jgi:hypothetical protein